MAESISSSLSNFYAFISSSFFSSFSYYSSLISLFIFCISSVFLPTNSVISVAKFEFPPSLLLILKLLLSNYFFLLMNSLFIVYFLGVLGVGVLSVCFSIFLLFYSFKFDLVYELTEMFVTSLYILNISFYYSYF